MARQGFKLNKAGVRQLLKSGEIGGVCKEYAEGVRSAAGDGYTVTEFMTKQRIGYHVSADTPHAYYSNLKHNTLEHAIGTVRK